MFTFRIAFRARRLMLACAFICLSASIAVAATASESLNNATLEQATAPYYASQNEELDINYHSGNPVRVVGDGRITTGNTQNWTVFAKDGLKWSGVITGAEDPRWRLVVQWNFESEAYGAGSSGSKHRANAGAWGVVQKDITGHDGHDYDVNADLRSAESYTFRAGPGNDGDGTIYVFDGNRKPSGGYSRIASGFSIDKDEWVNKAAVQVWVFARGWMTLKSNSSTTDVHTEVETNLFSGSFQAWDYDQTPPALLATYDLN